MNQFEGFINGVAHGVAALQMQSGPIATRLLNNGMDVNKALRTYSVLRKDEWKEMDDAVLEIQQSRLIAVGDLLSRNLVYRTNGLGTTVLEYEDVNDENAAELSMDGLTRADNDRPVYSIKYLPLPLTHKDWQINARVLAASRNGGSPLDTFKQQRASRKIAEKLEQMLITGTSSYTFGGGTIYGYLDHPSNNDVTLGAAWDAADSSSGSDLIGARVLADVLALKQALIDAGFTGGEKMLYIPTAYETVLDQQFKLQSDRSIREVIMAISGIADIKVLDELTADNVVMVQMSSDVVRMVVGLPVTNVEWPVEGGMATNFKTMTIQVPQIRADQDGNCGVALLS